MMMLLVAMTKLKKIGMAEVWHGAGVVVPRVLVGGLLAVGRIARLGQ